MKQSIKKIALIIGILILGLGFKGIVSGLIGGYERGKKADAQNTPIKLILADIPPVSMLVPDNVTLVRSDEEIKDAIFKSMVKSCSMYVGKDDEHNMNFMILDYEYVTPENDLEINYNAGLAGVASRVGKNLFAKEKSSIFYKSKDNPALDATYITHDSTEYRILLVTNMNYPHHVIAGCICKTDQSMIQNQVVNSIRFKY